MTENPFGEGGFDLGAMLEQAQQMQAQLVAAQEELAATTVEGSAGGVRITLTGTGELDGVQIAPGSFDGDDADSLTDLQDLIVAAYRDAKSQADAAAARTMGPLAGALGGESPFGDLPGLGGPGAGGPEAPPARPGGFGV